MNWSFCDEQDAVSTSDFENYDSPSTSFSDSRGSTFGSPDSYESPDARVQCQGSSSNVETNSIINQVDEGNNAANDTPVQNFNCCSKFDSSAFASAMNYGAKFLSEVPSGVVPSNTVDNLPVADLKAATLKMERFCSPTTELAASASLKRGRTPPSTVDSTAGSRSYRQQTSELINRLDKLLKFTSSSGMAASGKGARGAGGKGRSRRPPRDMSKPRARNVVLKQAAELIWRIKCDEQVNEHHWLKFIEFFAELFLSRLSCYSESAARPCQRL